MKTYTLTELRRLLETAGLTDTLQQKQIDSTVENMNSHFAGYVQRELTELENRASSLLRQKMDMSSLVRGEQSFLVEECNIKISSLKPDVSELVLNITIPNSQLAENVFPSEILPEELLKKIFLADIAQKTDDEVQNIRDQRIDEGLEDFTDQEVLFEKISQFVSLFNAGDMEQLRPVFDFEQLREQGWNFAVNSLVSILDNSKLSYQFIENNDAKRLCVIREYPETDPAKLPDEHFEMQLEYTDALRLKMSLSTITRKRTTLEQMSAVLPVFLQRITKTTRDVLFKG